MPRGYRLPDADLRPCGTLAACRRHYRRGEPLDEACRQAQARRYQDRVAAGYVRPSRAGRKRIHLAGTGVRALCGTRPRAVTADLDEVTCRGCVAVLSRHLEDEQAKEQPYAA